MGCDGGELAPGEGFGDEFQLCWRPNEDPQAERDFEYVDPDPSTEPDFATDTGGVAESEEVCEVVATDSTQVADVGVWELYGFAIVEDAYGKAAYVKGWGPEEDHIDLDNILVSRADGPDAYSVIGRVNPTLTHPSEPLGYYNCNTGYTGGGVARGDLACGPSMDVNCSGIYGVRIESIENGTLDELARTPAECEEWLGEIDVC